MEKEKAIVESVNFISEEDLLVQELERRLSFDMLAVSENPPCVRCSEVCGCLAKELQCPCHRANQTSTCGVRG